MKDLVIWHSRFSTVQEHEWCGFVATHCIYCAGWSQDLNCLLHLHRVLGSNSTGRENSLHTETISTAPVLFCETWHPWLNLWSWCWDSFSSRAYLPSSPYVQSNCLDAHLARGHSTTSGDNAVTVFQYLSISETCVNQGALYINWLSPSLINEDPGAHCFDETPSGIFSSWIHSLSGRPMFTTNSEWVWPTISKVWLLLVVYHYASHLSIYILVVLYKYRTSSQHTTAITHCTCINHPFQIRSRNIMILRDAIANNYYYSRDSSRCISPQVISVIAWQTSVIRILKWIRTSRRHNYWEAHGHTAILINFYIKSSRSHHQKHDGTTCDFDADGSTFC